MEPLTWRDSYISVVFSPFTWMWDFGCDDAVLGIFVGPISIYFVCFGWEP